MEKEYNWMAIGLGAVPVCVALFFVFSSGMSRNAKFMWMVLGMVLAAGITYFRDKKKHNIFTSPAAVFMVGVLFYGLDRLGHI